MFTSGHGVAADLLLSFQIAAKEQGNNARQRKYGHIDYDFEITAWKLMKWQGQQPGPRKFATNMGIALVMMMMIMILILSAYSTMTRRIRSGARTRAAIYS